MKIAVLALQGAFYEHETIIHELGADCMELRKKEDLQKPFDGLILPGGESTTQGKLLRELDMFAPLQEKIKNGLPVFATCAGLILLAENICNDDRTHFRSLPVTVKRNAYGRQLGSFHTVQNFGGMSAVPMTFIRAPYIESVGKDVEILARVDGNIVGVRYQNQLAISFHPELDSDRRVHRMFLESIR
ncbi:MAG: pyridoxal 5'-phosphate synthase glutaminase subunit PdxT [Lachnospiraceae bacterium]|nr:pyridoxal 5'-phosphate synthase glutaminase subunit PdxT [Lachnospiraceae bacterium]